MRLLKIGGSVITDKKRPYTAKMDVIEGIAKAISRVPVGDYMVGHGGGSFPHISAKKYRTAQGLFGRKSRVGAGIVHYDATWINQIFVKALHDAGVPAVSFHPNSFILAKDGKPWKVFSDPLLQALKVGLLPIFYGDVIVDKRRGVSIFSTESIIETLARFVKEPVVGMAEKYGGVYTADPSKDPDAELITEITPESLEDVLSYIGGSEGIDVTGGMKHKVEKLVSLAEQGIVSVIFRGTPENVERFLKGEKVEGTWFHD